MKIKQIEIFKLRIKLIEPFRISLGTWEYAENIIVVIRTDEGITGFGECSPFAPINGENIDTCLIVGKGIAGILKGRDPLNIEECSLAIDGFIYGNSSIKSAFDIALYDIASQNAHQPLYIFLGGKNDKEIITDYTVSIGEPHKMAADARKIQEQGFQVIKVKLGGTKEEDIERVRAIRVAIGKDLPIRIDANQGWKSISAAEILNALSEFNIQYCEEPIPRWDFMQLPGIRKESLIPIMADECCSDHHDVQRLIDLKACDYFNIKLGKSSGIYKALKMIKLAEQGGIKIQMGGFMESRLGFTAAAHLALSSENIIYYDFDTPLMFMEDPVNGGIRYDVGGKVSIPNGIGLGAGIDEGYWKEEKLVIA